MKQKLCQENTPGFRPIHYLGSKLRMLDTIGGAMDQLAAPSSMVCDLFSGSGTVSRFLSKAHPVVSVDIQEYSRVLCSAALFTPKLESDASLFLSEIRDSNILNQLQDAAAPLLQYEKNAIESAKKEVVEPLYSILENGSIITLSDSTPQSPLKAAIQETIDNLKRRGLWGKPSSMVTCYYGGLYFSYAQAILIDAVLDQVFEKTTNQPLLRDMLLAAAISSVSEIVNTVGKQFAQPLRVKKTDGTLKKGLLKKILSDRSISFLDTLEAWLREYQALEPSPYRSHLVLRSDYMEALSAIRESGVAAVYADPPYTRYHYSRYYHVLETICLRDMPGITPTFPNGSTPSRAIYREGRHQSPFCIRSQAGEAFDKLFSGVAALRVPFVLSYSPFSEGSKSVPRLQTIDQLVQKASSYYRSVEILSPGHFVHSKLNASEKNYDALQDAERLIVCQIPK